MTCHEIKQLFPDYLIGDIDDRKRESVQVHLADCGDCRTELESLSEIWTKLGVIPEERPSDVLRGRFYGMLDAYKRELEKQPREPHWQRAFAAWLERWWPRQPAYQLGITMLVLAAGITTGIFIRGGAAAGRQSQALSREVRNLRLTMASSLLDHQSASERIKGINVSTGMSEPDSGLLAQLLETLDNDTSINVRLAAVDALFLFRDHPVVRAGLARSLSRQQSPLVQMAMIDLMVSIRENRAVEALRSLLENQDLNQEVKKRAEQGLADLL